jgi:hypothetical protein
MDTYTACFWEEAYYQKHHQRRYWYQEVEMAA